jgi:cytochrome c biogenesis protein CcmG/thiol:disulfide interchange protein DsbE
MANQQSGKLMLILAAVAVVILGVGYFVIGANDAAHSHKSDGQTAKAAAANTQPDQHQTAPDFQLNDLKGNVVSLGDFKDKVVFLNFWATWCGPCRQEIPHFIDLVEQYGDDGFVVLGVALDSREFDKVPAFVKENGINYPIVLDDKGVSNLYGGIRSIPTTFVINREGKAVEQIIGVRPKDVFEGIIKKWL